MPTSGILHVGRTYRHCPEGGDDTGGPVLRNGKVWDLTGANVYARFVKPDGSVLEEEAFVVDPLTGWVRWDNPAPFFAAADLGDWQFTWRVVQGSIDVILEEPERFVLAS